MSVRIELVDLGKNPASSSERGFPREVFAFERNDKTNINVAQSNPISRSVLLESINGDASVEPRRKRRRLAVEGVLTTAQLLRLYQLKEEERPLFFCPNVGPTTIWSVPLFRGLDAIVGPTLSYTRTGYFYQFDEDRGVLQRFAADVMPAAFGGPYGRFAQPANASYINRASKPHPDSVSTGWSVGAGTGYSVQYDDEMPTPLLANRGTAGAQGMAVLVGDGSGTAGRFDHSASLLSSGAHLCATLYIITAHDILVTMSDAVGAIADSVSVSGAPGVVQRVQLYGPQSSGGTTATVSIWPGNASGDARVIHVGPVFIGNSLMSTDDHRNVPDWVDASAIGAGTSGGVNAGFRTTAPELTISLLGRCSNNAWAACELDTTTDVGLYFNPIDDGYVQLDYGAGTITRDVGQFGVARGDWMHIVATIAEDQCNIFINGQQTSPSTISGVTTGDFGTYKSIGRHATTRVCEGDAGIMLLRVDKHAWSEAEAQRHCATYFRDIGRAFVAPNFGRSFIIDRIEHEQFSVNKDGTLYTTQLMLSQLKEYDEFAPVGIIEAVE